MGKNPTFPKLYNEALQIRLSKLKEWEYFKEPEIKSGTLKWSRNGSNTGSISISMNTLIKPYYLEVKYTFNDEPRNYKIEMITVPSNLGRGVIWFFVCPQTGKRCRVLYSIGGYFYHRSAFKGCMYEVQTYSKKRRLFNRIMGSEFFHSKIIYSRYFKRYYAGKPTKRYMKILKQTERNKRITTEDIKRVLYS